MATIRIEAQTTPEDLFQAVSQLGAADLDRFVQKVIALQAQSKAPHLSRAEADLLLKINQGLPPDVQQRYSDLQAKRDAETLTPEEHAELMILSDQAEALNTQRIQALAELAQLRHTSLTQVMKDLGIRTPSHA